MQCSWFDSGYIFGVSLRVLMKEFLAFLRDGEPGSRGRGSHLEIRTLFRQAALMTSLMVFRRILRHFSHSVRMDVSAHFSALDLRHRGLRVADAGSLLPGVLPPALGA